MSRFFRNPTDSNSSDEDEDDEVSHDSKVAAPGDSESQAVGGLESLALTQRSQNETHRDALLHALLEERCRNDVLREQQWAHRPTEEIEAECRARYQRLCAQLAPLNLISVGLEQDSHSSTRQAYRDGLDLLSNQKAAPPALQKAGRKLLMATSSSLPVQPDWSRFEGPSALSMPNPLRKPSIPGSQYLRDFEEIGVLGKGGYGTVYHVRHRLDSHVYAIKKIRLRPSTIARIHSDDHQRELEETLLELRTLAKLEHPNIVRYYSSWVELVAPSEDRLPASGDGFLSYSTDRSDTGFGHDESHSVSLHRITTAATDSTANDDMGVVFGELSDSSGSTQDGPSHSVSHSHRSATNQAHVNDEHSVVFSAEIENPVAFSDAVSSRLSAPGALLHSNEPTLALHIQMAMYPMTLADFLSPNIGNRMAKEIAPLVHCFHLETSIRIMLALLDGVDYIHSRGIIHRDLKPANVFIRLEKNPRSKQGCIDLLLCSQCRATSAANPATISVCIGDFGLVGKIAADPVNPDLPPKHPGPSAPPVVGTELYRPPADHPPRVGPSIDIFALGIIAFELLYKFNTQMERRETLQKLRQGRFPAHFPSAAEELISAMLAADQQKATTVTELRQKLSAMLGA